MEAIVTRRQILEAITPLSHLNRWARTPYEHRRDMHSAASAIYHMKNRVIRAALDEGYSRAGKVRRSLHR